MILTLIEIIKQDVGRYARDKRRKVNTIIASYKDEDGFEYRKRFSSYGCPNVPSASENNYLTSLQEQF